jgi:hypothetical protein
VARRRAGTMKHDMKSRNGVPSICSNTQQPLKYSSSLAFPPTRLMTPRNSPIELFLSFAKSALRN